MTKRINITHTSEIRRGLSLSEGGVERHCVEIERTPCREFPRGRFGIGYGKTKAEALEIARNRFSWSC